MFVHWHAYHVQDGRSVLLQAEEIQVDRSQCPYQIHLAQYYDRLPILDEVRHVLLPNGQGHHHLVHLVPDYAVHVALWYVMHVLLVL